MKKLMQHKFNTNGRLTSLSLKAVCNFGASIIREPRYTNQDTGSGTMS